MKDLASAHIRPHELKLMAVFEGFIDLVGDRTDLTSAEKYLVEMVLWQFEHTAVCDECRQKVTRKRISLETTGRRKKKNGS